MVTSDPEEPRDEAVHRSLRVLVREFAVALEGGEVAEEDVGHDGGPALAGERHGAHRRGVAERQLPRPVTEDLRGGERIALCAGVAGARVAKVGGDELHTKTLRAADRRGHALARRFGGALGPVVDLKDGFGGRRTRRGSGPLLVLLRLRLRLLAVQLAALGRAEIVGAAGLGLAEEAGAERFRVEQQRVAELLLRGVLRRDRPVNTKISLVP